MGVQQVLNSRADRIYADMTVRRFVFTGMVAMIVACSLLISFYPAVGCWPTDIGESARRQATGQLEGNANTPFGIKHAVIVVVIV